MVQLYVDGPRLPGSICYIRRRDFFVILNVGIEIYEAQAREFYEKQGYVVRAREDN